jgi:hypothetical protein
MRRLALAVALAVTFAGCARMANTPQQEMAWRAWKQQCEASFPTVKLERVYADGSTSFSAPSPDALQAAHECMRQNPPH